jgi:CYTH domain-containing protein
MGFEIERKFLVLPEWIDHIREKSAASSHIVQGYLSRKPAIRVRISNLHGHQIVMGQRRR